LVHRAKALFEPPLVDPSGRCVQESLLELSRRQEQTLAGGIRRSFALNSTVRRDRRYIVIEERLLVRDTDLSAPLSPPREVQRIDANRFVRVHDGRLLSQQHPLWARALTAAGATLNTAAR
jgi:hypothetical protein